MRRSRDLRVAMLILPMLTAACDGAEDQSLTSETQAVRGSPTPIRIGVLIDDASPAKANFTAAATLAESQINAGLAAAHSRYRVDVIPGYYGGTTGKTQATRTIDLVNLEGIHGVVSDVSGVPGGLTGTVSVNRLNYESPRRIDHPIPVTCYQCSSAFFNDPSQSDPGFSDPDNWLWRTFFKASFESAVQVRMVLNRPNNGDFNGDGRTKIVVYYDQAHLSAATTFSAFMDQIYGALPHSVETVAKTLPSDPGTRAAELARVFDAHNDQTGQDDGLPDSIYLAYLPNNIPEALADYAAYPISPRPPATANNGARRDFLLPTLLASGGEGLEGNSVLLVAASAAGRAFLASFRAATGGQNPELTASYVYDAIAAQALAALTAAARGSLAPEAIREGLGRISSGKLVKAGAQGFKKAANQIERHHPIDYDGAGSALDLQASDGEMFPDIVHWKIQGGQFVELEAYRCDLGQPTCQARP